MSFINTRKELLATNSKLMSTQEELSSLTSHKTSLQLDIAVPFNYDIEGPIALAVASESSVLLTIDGEISHLRGQATMLAITPVAVDEHQIRNDIESAMAELPKMEAMLITLNDTFTELFGGTQAREMLLDATASNYDGKVTYEDILQLKSKYEKLENSVIRIQSIHKDSFVTFSRILCFNMTGLINSESRNPVVIMIKRQLIKIQHIFTNPEKLLLWYIVYALFICFVVKSNYLLHLAVMSLLTTTLVITVYNYIAFVKDFKDTLQLEIMLQKLSESVDDEVKSLLTVKEAEAKEARDREINKLNQLIDNKLEERSMIEDKIKLKESEFRAREVAKSIQLREEHDKRIAALNKKLEDLQEDESQLYKTIEALKAKKLELEDSILYFSGLKPGLKEEEKEQIMSTDILIGFDDVTAEPITFQIKEPTFIQGDINYTVNILLTQLLGRVLATKVRIYIYAPNTLGRDYIRYINKSNADEGVIILPNNKALDETLAEFESNSIVFQYALKDFKDLEDYNNFMVESDGVTKPYTVVIFEDLPQDITMVNRFTETLGHYWIALSSPVKKDELVLFDNIFKNRVSY